MDEEKKKYVGTYRCSICNEIIPRGNAVAMTEQQAIDYPSTGGMWQKIVHKCNDGSIGVAYFAGMKVQND